MRFYECAEAFGWTWDQYADTPNEAITAVLAVHRAVNKGQREESEAAQNRANAPHIG